MRIVFNSDKDIFTQLKLFFNHPNEKTCMNFLALQIQLWACFKTQVKANCFLFFLFLILRHLFQNKIVEFGKMQFNVQGVKIKPWFKDFWRYPVHNPENRSKHTGMKVIKTKKNISKSDGLSPSNMSLSVTELLPFWFMNRYSGAPAAQRTTKWSLIPI